MIFFKKEGRKKNPAACWISILLPSLPLLLLKKESASLDFSERKDTYRGKRLM
jgi:hypothetical protein